MRWLVLLLLAMLAAPVPAAAAHCDTTGYDGASFTWCRIDLSREELRLWLADDAAEPWGSFHRLDAALAETGRHIGVAMNGGMFHTDRSPVGLYIEDGEERAPIVTSDGPGNFGLLPNGVFCIGERDAQVIESRAYAAAPPPCRFATQSGPMLLIDGALHPKFLKDSDSLYIRNGVGVRAGGREVILAISDEPVNFHHFARFFRDVAETPDALFLDGDVSRLYAPGIDRFDMGFPVGPILGTVEPDG
ncbi:phosphodiester glycosidase family protein [Psychromarinibacter sp. C21-152]|uniref:Phosphodiester glycosidase family protein n=1 Tax=Psychromarinibacter sediminicola TaxID=3033385 RepID=A0AAE3NTL0_9RHOB|nr:phosphodiester glycosidase family protein [Psychromarinibacter sediminicola]MDF0601811.1 phosphodiester glycosidase family protein [Psychromarinibacter sediminicola]